MNQFWLFTFCIAAFVASAMSDNIVCNAGAGLRSISGTGDISCYTPVANQTPKQWRCSWSKCTPAIGQDCLVNDHQWDRSVKLTCDKDYILNPQDDAQIQCNVNQDVAKKCTKNPNDDCDSSQNDSYEAICKTIIVRSHCRDCVPF